MKLRDHPLFLSIALILAFPIGLLLLIFSAHKPITKWIMAAAGLLLSAALLSVSILVPTLNKRPCNDNFELTVSRDILSVGQSGGVSLSAGNRYIGNYKIEAENDVLKLDGNIYTAVTPGSCTINVTYDGKTHSVQISVDNRPKTDTTVFASPTGERYHNVSSHAGKNQIELTEEDALQSGKTPCKICYK